MFKKTTRVNSLWNRLWNRSPQIVQTLPKVRGKLTKNEPMAKKNWFGVGGSAQVYFEPADTEDLLQMVRHMPSVPLTILGAGSNVLIRDGGIPGITVHLGKAFSSIRVEGEQLICGAGALVMEVSRTAEKNSLSGFEFLCGIPGTVGGGIRMNAGAYGFALSDKLVRLKIMTKEGEIQSLEKEELSEAFAYRNCYLPPEWIFLEAVFQGKKEADSVLISERMQENKHKREIGQPIGVRTAGSTFKNPEGTPAWQLIEKAGMRGARIGGAAVSNKHANFLINTGHATAQDIEKLGNQIREKVREKEGITLEWEVKKIGVEK